MSEKTSSTQEITISEEEFMYSISYFFIKSKFKLTNKRIEGEIPNLTLFIPTGKDSATYSLNNISGVKISTKFYLKSFIIGLILTLIGLPMLGDSFLIGLIMSCVGISTLLNSFRSLIVVQNSGGSSMAHAIAPMERTRAQIFVSKINDIIAGNL
ncbi:MAG: hypothetical protein JJT76_15565 [Clostridiaceae bacterium]|nr:hypothetical protein [Clostridiaceae bacterium]